MSDQKILTTELFGAPSPRRYKIVGPLPVRGGKVRIRSLTEKESQAFQMACVNTRGAGELRRDRLLDANRRLIAACLVDAEGNPFVTDAQRAEMAEWDNADTSYLYDECARHTGIKQSDIEDLVKNSDGTTVAG